MQYSINLSALQKSFHKLQGTLHPDKFHGKTEREMRYSREQSASLNNAYSTLVSPLLRAQYLLQLNGRDVLSENKSITDSVFLGKILETRERLMNADEDKEEVNKIAEEIKKEYLETVSNLKENFQKNDFEAAKKNTINLQYQTKILEEIENTLGCSIISTLNKQVS